MTGRDTHLSAVSLLQIESIEQGQGCRLAGDGMEVVRESMQQRYHYTAPIVPRPDIQLPASEPEEGPERAVAPLPSAPSRAVHPRQQDFSRMLRFSQPAARAFAPPRETQQASPLMALPLAAQQSDVAMPDAYTEGVTVTSASISITSQQVGASLDAEMQDMPGSSAIGPQEPTRRTLPPAGGRRRSQKRGPASDEPQRSDTWADLLNSVPQTQLPAGFVTFLVCRSA